MGSTSHNQISTGLTQNRMGSRSKRIDETVEENLTRLLIVGRNSRNLGDGFKILLSLKCESRRT